LKDLTILQDGAALLYNFGAAILRAMGDSQRPLFYITVGGIANVILNVILCLVLPQKVAAVAISTVVSKIISGGLVLHRLCTMEGERRVSLKKIRFDLAAFGNIIRFGIPTSISSLLYPIANLQVVPAINSFGVEAVAGNSASAHIYNIVGSFNGFANTTTVFMGQNIGAGHRDRVKKTFWYCLGFGILIALTIGTLAYQSGEFWLGLILGTSSHEAIGYGMIRMFYLTQFLFINLANSVLIHALQAYGYPIFGSISSIAFTLGFRIFWMQVIYPKYPVFDSVMACFVVSWTLNMIFNAVFVAIFYRRYNKGIYKKI
jgi:Na+-driven multidrug efflux pump